VAATSAAVFSVLKFAGAAYLVYLGVQTWRHRGDLAAALGRPGAPPGRRVFLQGVVVGATNPKVLVLFVALLPQFTDPGAGNPELQMLVLGLLFALLAAVLDSVWGLAAGAARDWFATSPARLSRVGGTGGLMMIGLGATVALTGRRD
jgi:threonine/homoserine/homoserine lactone efflux protein